jgi:hypothetical protein
MNLVQLRQYYTSATPPRRELILAAALALLGLTALPVAVYMAGYLTLGQFEGSGFWHFFATLYKSLFKGSTAAWAMVAGPYVLLWLWRGLRLWWRRSEALARP